MTRTTLTTAADLLHLLAQPLVRRLAGGIALTLQCAIYILGSYPAVVEKVVVFWDKAVHFSAYGLIAGFWLVALRSPRLAVAMAVAGGALDEWIQLHVPGRSAGLDDLGADALGALAVSLIGQWLCRPDQKSPCTTGKPSAAQSSMPPR